MLLAGAAGGLPGFAHRYRAESKVGRQARAGIRAGQRAGHVSPVGAAAIVQKGAQAFDTGGAAAGLALPAIIRAEAEVFGDRPEGRREGRRADLFGGAGARRRHQRFPAPGPAFTVLKAAHDAVLGLLTQRDAGIAGPAAQLPVTVERPLQASLLMRVDRLDAVFTVQGRDHISGGAGAHNEAAATSLEGGVEFAQRVEDKVELPARMFRQGPVARLENVNG